MVNIAEIVLAVALMAAGLAGFIPFSTTPWLLLLAAVSLWRRGPGWRAVGLRRPDRKAIAIGLAVGVLYQFVGLYVVEPILARFTTGALPDVSRLSRTGWVVAAIVTSALFGIVHLYQGVSGVLATGLTGLVVALAYFASGRNLWTAILAHGFMDTAGFVMIYLGIYPGI